MPKTKPELCMSELTGNVYCITEWKKAPTTEQPYGEAKTKHDVTDSFEQLSRRAWEKLYIQARDLWAFSVSDIMPHLGDASLDAETLQENLKSEMPHLYEMRDELIRFGLKADLELLQAPNWIERVTEAWA